MTRKYIKPDAEFLAGLPLQMLCDSMTTGDTGLEDFTDGGTYEW